jgi:hypothetical protein
LAALSTKQPKLAGILLYNQHKLIVMKKGDTVHWNWGKGEAEGKIEKKHEEPVTKTIKGSKIKRNASKDEPAFEIKMDKGQKVIKSESELKKGGK